MLDKKEMFDLIRANEGNFNMPEAEVEAIWKSYIDASWDKSKDEYINEHELQFIFDIKKGRKFNIQPKRHLALSLAEFEKTKEKGLIENGGFLAEIECCVSTTHCFFDRFSKITSTIT